MSTTTTTYGTRTEYGTDSNLNSLASAATKPIGAIDNSSTGACGFLIDYTIVLASSSVSSTGTISFFLMTSGDGTNYTDGISPTASTDQTSGMKNAAMKLVHTAIANANSQTCRDSFELPRTFAPKYHTLLIQNNSGAALASSGHSVYYTPINFAIA